MAVATTVPGKEGVIFRPFITIHAEENCRALPRRMVDSLPQHPSRPAKIKLGQHPSPRRVASFLFGTMRSWPPR